MISLSRWIAVNTVKIWQGMIVAGALLAGLYPCAAQQAAGQGSGGPQIAGCPVFPADNIWNVPIDKLPVDPPSKVYINTIGANLPLHADFASDPLSGIPYQVIDSTVKYVKVTVD
jgi:hypothetical protein